MSALPMYKTCINCGSRFTYNPSIGDLGFVCKNCGKPANIPTVSKKEYPLKNILKDIFMR